MCQPKEISIAPPQRQLERLQQRSSTPNGSAISRCVHRLLCVIWSVSVGLPLPCCDEHVETQNHISCYPFLLSYLMLHRTTVFKVFSFPEGEHENIEIPGGYGFTFIHRLQWKRISVGLCCVKHCCLTFNGVSRSLISCCNKSYFYRMVVRHITHCTQDKMKRWEITFQKIKLHTAARLTIKNVFPLKQ